MSSALPDSKIQSLTAWPITKGYKMAVPSGIDETNYLIISTNREAYKIEFISKYSVCDSAWAKIDLTCDLTQLHHWGLSAVDNKKQIIYYLMYAGLQVISLNSGQIETHSVRLPDNLMFTGSARLVLFNDSLFLMGLFYNPQKGPITAIDLDNNAIFKYNLQNNQMIKFAKMPAETDLCGFGVFIDKKRGHLLLFGGYDSYKCEYVDSILRFNFATKEWNQVLLTLPKKMSDMCCTMAVRNKYVITFGGLDIRDKYDDIYVYSIKQETLKKSNIKCPRKSCDWAAITVSDDEKDEKTVFG
ncbi:MAG: hypothetical protein GY928_04475, partial [Colwellia sp.]|nr:hypothetical protein [Colwellia sp.]